MPEVQALELRSEAIMDMPEDLEPKRVPAEKWLYDQEYWSLNCNGDPSNCLGCHFWGGEGICLFDDAEEISYSASEVKS